MAFQIKDMEEKDILVILNKRGRDPKSDPDLVKQKINQQEKLIQILKENDKDTPDCLQAIGNLLDAGVDALAPDYNISLYNNLGNVCLPLHCAAVKDLPNVMALLLKHNSHPDVPDRAGVTAAHLAADAGSVECLKRLIAAGADVNATSIWFRCAKKEMGDAVVLWALELLSKLHLPYQENTTPLHLAAQGGHLECVRVLLDNGANVNAVNIKKQTPLYLAAKEGHSECVMMLLQNTGDCPDVSIPTTTGDTALLECFRHGEKMRACITELVHRGADVCHPNSRGVSAVHAALCYRWDMDMMKLLVVEGRGMDFDRTNTSSPSPFKAVTYRQLIHYRNGIGADPPAFTDQDESAALLFLRMGATRIELKKLLWHELNLPRHSGVLLETLMDSFAYLPSLSKLEAECGAQPARRGPTPWRLPAYLTNEARRQKEEELKEIVAGKKRYYQQRSTEVPSLAHLCRAAIRSHLQADVRKVISWPVPECHKRFILLDYKL